MYKWRVRSRIYGWYEDVKAVDLKADRDRSPERLASHMAELDRIEDQVNRISTALPYAGQLYDLRVHIDLVRGKLEKAMQNVTG
jgi:hypothetical protein